MPNLKNINIKSVSELLCLHNAGQNVSLAENMIRRPCSIISTRVGEDESRMMNHKWQKPFILSKHVST